MPHKEADPTRGEREAGRSFDARALRREIETNVASARPDLERLAECFESLRDRTEDPRRLFAIAVGEMDATVRVFERTRSADAFRAAVLATLRVIEGEPRRAVRREIRRGVTVAERLLRSTPGRSIRALDRQVVDVAIARGLHTAGDDAAALRRLDRSWMRSAALRGREGLRRFAQRALCDAAFDLAIDASEYANALRWAARRSDLLARDADARRSGAYADALGVIPSLCLACGRFARALSASDAWLEAERRIESDRPSRVARVLDALRTAATAAAIVAERPGSADADRYAAAARAARYTDAALQAIPDGADANSSFECGRAEEAIVAELDLRTRQGTFDAKRAERLAAATARLLRSDPPDRRSWATTVTRRNAPSTGIRRPRRKTR